MHLSLSLSAPFAETRTPRRSLGHWVDRIESLVLKLMVGLLVLVGISCGFGVQHITYVRQKTALCQQLRQTEIELHQMKQTCRSLEFSLANQAAQGPCLPELPQIASQQFGRILKAPALDGPVGGAGERPASGWSDRRDALQAASLTTCTTNKYQQLKKPGGRANLLKPLPQKGGKRT